MTYTPDMQFAKQTLHHRLPLKNMPRDVGELYLDRYLPELTDEQREYMLALCGQKIAPLKNEPSDALFCAAMFMAGVSQGDLAALFGVRKQTVQVKIYAHTTKAERETMREQRDKLDLESVALAREIYILMCKGNKEIHDKSATELGRLLLNAADQVVQRDRGEGESAMPTPDRPRRYSNRNTSDGKTEAAALVAQAHEKMEQQPEMPPPSELPPIYPSTPNVVRPDEQSFLDSLMEE